MADAGENKTRNLPRVREAGWRIHDTFRVEIGLADVAVRANLGYVCRDLLHMMTLFYADEAVGAFVMVLLLRKVSINQRLSLAVQVTFATKTFSVVVGGFLVTILLLRTMA